MVVLAIADEATIKQLDKYKDMLAQLGDPRKTTEEQARNSSRPPSRSIGSRAASIRRKPAARKC